MGGRCWFSFIGGVVSSPITQRVGEAGCTDTQRTLTRIGNSKENKRDKSPPLSFTLRLFWLCNMLPSWWASPNAEG